MTTELDSLT